MNCIVTERKRVSIPSGQGRLSAATSLYKGMMLQMFPIDGYQEENTCQINDHIKSL